VLVVHLYGLPVDLPPVLALAAAHDLVLLEDCSHAHGATFEGRRVGSFGRAAAFSLGVVKNLAAYGDAGVVTTDDATVAATVRLLGTHGQEYKNEHVLYGGNSRLDELHAAMLRVKLRLLDARNRRRAAIAAHYDACLDGLVTTPLADPRRTHVYHQYVVRTSERDRLRAFLAEQAIDTGVHYPVPIHRQRAWLDAFGETPALPGAERVAREILSLPVHPDLTDAEVERVADAVVAYFAR
jgi:dTDP-4-amino-4,6-dideoxygalactose transaminase